MKPEKPVIESDNAYLVRFEINAITIEKVLDGETLSEFFEAVNSCETTPYWLHDKLFEREHLFKPCDVYILSWSPLGNYMEWVNEQKEAQAQAAKLQQAAANHVANEHGGIKLDS